MLGTAYHKTKSATFRLAARLAILPLLCVSNASATEEQAEIEFAKDSDDAWLEDDWETQIQAVNEGELTFLEKPPDRRVLNTRNSLEVTPESIRTGWVGLYQCQVNLDPLSSVEIVYRYKGIRNLRIVSFRRIGSTEVTSHTVQLTDVASGAEVCIRAEVRVLKKIRDSVYEIKSGPFHRRFLDGYFPVHLQYSLTYPPDVLAIESVTPVAQRGFVHKAGTGNLDIDAWFEGKLTITVRFQSVSEKVAATHAAHSSAIPLL